MRVPVLLLVLVPLTLLIAASRVVLGLHYPSDVAAGGLLGAALGLATMALLLMLRPCPLFVSDVYFPRVNGVSTSIRSFRQDLTRLGMESTLVAPQYLPRTRRSKRQSR